MPEVRLFSLVGAVHRHPDVERWFAQPTSDLGGLAKRWFDELRAAGPDVEELLHDGNPTVCVNGMALGYVAVHRAHVNVGFFLGTSLPDPACILQGTGRFMRHVKVQPGALLDEAALKELVAAAYSTLKQSLATR